jgi:hypothetical protein
VRVNGSIQIADGLFIGDYNSCMDHNFLKLNKVYRIINAAANGDVQNVFDPNEYKHPLVKEILQKKGQGA